MGIAANAPESKYYISETLGPFFSIMQLAKVKGFAASGLTKTNKNVTDQALHLVKFRSKSHSISAINIVQIKL